MKFRFVGCLLVISFFSTLLMAVELPQARQIEARKAIASLGQHFSPEGFIYSIRNGDAVAFEMYLQAGIDFNAGAAMPDLYPNCSFEGVFNTAVTPLFVAVHAARTEFVNRLLEVGAAVETQNSVCTYDGITPFMIAVDIGQIPLAEKLLAKGAKINALDKKGRTTLDIVVNKEDDVKMVQFLLGKGAKPNAEGQKHPPLIQAAIWKLPKTATLLLEHGADPNAMDENGNTPLSSAVAKGDLAMMKLLFAKGAKISVKESSHYSHMLIRDALWQSGNPEAVVGLLKQQGIDIEARDRSGHSPLSEAAGDNLMDQVKVLLKHGANPNLKTKEGFNAVDHALDQRHSDVAALLVQHGGKKSR